MNTADRPIETDIEATTVRSCPSDQEVVLVAMLELDGQHHSIALENIAMKAALQPPHRFRWRHYPGQVDLEAIRAILHELANPPGNKSAVVGDEDGGWLLNRHGIVRAMASRASWPSIESSACVPDLVPSSASDLAIRDPVVTTLETEKRRALEYARLREDPAFIKARDAKAGAITRREAENCFRLDDYALGAARRIRIERLRNLFLDDAETSAALDEIERHLSCFESSGANAP